MEPTLIYKPHRIQSKFIVFEIMLTKYIVATLLLASTVLCSSNLFAEEETSEENYPFLVSLRLDNYHWCVGTIVASKWVLTAAHCTDVPQNKTLSVQYGVKKPSNDGQNVVSVKGIHVYRGWDVEEPRVHDIALIELAEQIPFDMKTVGPVSLPTKDYVGETEVPAVLTSWTLNGTNGAFSDNVEELPLEIQTKEECRRRLRGLLSTFGNICTNSADIGTDQQCFMFGGPLIYGGVTQLGIATVQNGSHHCAVPDLYIKVSLYVPWILSTIG